MGLFVKTELNKILTDFVTELFNNVIQKEPDLIKRVKIYNKYIKKIQKIFEIRIEEINPILTKDEITELLKHYIIFENVCMDYKGNIRLNKVDNLMFAEHILKKINWFLEKRVKKSLSQKGYRYNKVYFNDLTNRYYVVSKISKKNYCIKANEVKNE